MFIDLKDKDKRTGWIVSIAVHAVIVFLFFFILAWQAPDPPLPEYGIELNIGIEQAGSGNQQPVTTPTPPVEEEVGEPEEQIEEVQEETVEEEAPAEPVEESPAEDLPDSQQEDSPVETQPSESVPVEEPVEEQIEETVEETSEEIVEEPVEEEPKVEEKVVNENALYPGAASQGTKQDEAGDAGDPEGTVDARAIYGKSGGGNDGPSLELAGWRWDSEPRPNDNSNENGRIIFEIKVDDNGEVIGVRTIETTVSATVVQLYRSEVEKLTFSPLSSNTIPAAVSTGKITFIIRSR